MQIRSLCLAAVFATAIATTLPTFAAQRTFVASFGNDANPCSIASPCRSFTRALTQTEPNGEVIVLDSAGYGAFTISQSVSIIAPAGVYAGISVFSGTGISIAGPGIRVTLRGLTINGQGGDLGVSFTQGSRLVMEDCTVKGLNVGGLLIDSGAVEATLANLRVEDNGTFGIRVFDGGNVSVSRSVISGHSASGIRVEASVAATPTRGVITDSVLSHNGEGIIGFSQVPGTQVRVVAARNQVMNGFIGIVGQDLNCADASCVQVVATDNVVQDMTNSGILASGGTTVVASRNTVTNSGVSSGGGLVRQSNGAFISMQDNVSELNLSNSTTTPGTLR